MDLPILFEDASLLVINKPPGIVVNRAESVKGETVQDWMVSKYPSLFTESDDFCSRAGIVHRIDKETSGCLLIAKNISVFVTLQAQFKDRTIHKTYVAFAHGKIVPEIGEINAPVARLPWNRERFGIVPGGKDSVTKYKVLRSQFIVHRKARVIFSFVELYPETGRTHQIRVHLKYINHPIVGDFQYAGRKTSRDDRVWASRVMLHAKKIIFHHPVCGEDLAIEAPMPDDMSRILSESTIVDL